MMVDNMNFCIDNIEQNRNEEEVVSFNDIQETNQVKNLGIENPNHNPNKEDLIMHLLKSHAVNNPNEN